jgi:hypothetical protein
MSHGTAAALPICVKIRPDWPSNLTPDLVAGIVELSFDIAFCDNSTDSVIASDCLRFFMELPDAASFPGFPALLERFGDSAPSDATHVTALSIARKTYHPEVLQNLIDDQRPALIGPHVDFFYNVLASPTNYDQAGVREILLCLKALVPATPGQFEQSGQTIRLCTLLSALCNGFQVLYGRLLLVTFHYRKNVL